MTFKVCAVCGMIESTKEIKRIGCLNIGKEHLQHEEVINLQIRNEITTEQIRINM